MKVKNKLTRETLEITYPEFRKKFVKEIQTAFENYRRTQLNKYFTILKMITQWNTISISNYNGTSTTLEFRIGILRKCKFLFLLFLTFYKIKQIIITRRQYKYGHLVK